MKSCGPFVYGIVIGATLVITKRALQSRSVLTGELKANFAPNTCQVPFNVTTFSQAGKVRIIRPSL
jgi:hypothetical protein